MNVPEVGYLDIEISTQNLKWVKLFFFDYKCEVENSDMIRIQKVGKKDFRI